MVDHRGTMVMRQVGFAATVVIHLLDPSTGETDQVHVDQAWLTGHDQRLALSWEGE
jgi:hypothetical protein